MSKTLALCLAALLLLSALLPAGGSAQAVRPPRADLKERIWPDESIYFIFLDRFRNGDKSNDGNVNPQDPRTWHGGDLQGVIDALDYIKSLGFTAIWITPHVRNVGRDYHGYGAVDFFDTDPHFGTVSKARELVEQAHARGIRVLFDVVVNHTDPSHPLVSEKPDWFHPRRPITDWNDPKQVQEGWIFGLPDFDQSKPEVRQYILSYSKFWIEQTGVDGFRLDTVKHVDPQFFKWYSAELQKVRPGFWLLGEVWERAPWKLAVYQDAGVTALLDFPVSESARGVFARDESMTRLAAAVSGVGGNMADPWQMAGFLDNHDMPRFMTEAIDDPVRRLKLGLLFLFTQRSIPVLYYGTEIAMTGGNDPLNRGDFPWNQEEHTDVQDLVRRLNQIRSAHPALRRGDVSNLPIDAWRYAYLRTAGDDKAVVVLNNHATEAFAGTVDVSRAGLADGTVLEDGLTGKQVTVVGGKLRPEVGPRSGAVYIVRPSLPTWAWVGAGAAAVLIAGALWWRRTRFPARG